MERQNKYPHLFKFLITLYHQVYYWHRYFRLKTFLSGMRKVMRHEAMWMVLGQREGHQELMDYELIIVSSLHMKPGPCPHSYWIRFQELTFLSTCLAVCLKSPRWLGKNLVEPVQIRPHGPLKTHHPDSACRENHMLFKGDIKISKSNMSWHFSMTQAWHSWFTC